MGAVVGARAGLATLPAGFFPAALCWQDGLLQGLAGAGGGAALLHGFLGAGAGGVGLLQGFLGAGGAGAGAAGTPLQTWPGGQTCGGPLFLVTPPPAPPAAGAAGAGACATTAATRQVRNTFTNMAAIEQNTENGRENGCIEL